MATGIIDHTTRQDEVRTVWKCFEMCDDRPENNNVLNLFGVEGELTGGYEYEYSIEHAPAREYIVGPWDDTSVTGLPVSAEAAKDLAYPMVLDVEGEYVVVTYVDRTANTIDVESRGYAGTTAASHAAGTTATRIGRALQFCSSDYECDVVETGDTIVNGRQIFPACVEYCEDELCILRDRYSDCGRSTIDESINQAKRSMLADINSALVNSRYSSYKDGTPSFRGIRQEFLENGNIYNVATDDSCVGTSGDGTLALIPKVIQRATRLIQRKGGRANFALVSFNTYTELADLLQSQDCAANACADGLIFKDVQFLDTPIGRLFVLWSEDVHDDEIFINHSDNLKRAPFCNKPFPYKEDEIIPDPSNPKISKWTAEADFTTRFYNTCRDALVITGFVNGQNAC